MNETLTEEQKRQVKQLELRKHLVNAGIDPDKIAPDLDHHLLLNRDRPELRRFIRILRKAHKNGYSNFIISIAHDEDGTCCSIETFDKTQARLIFEFTDKIIGKK